MTTTVAPLTVRLHERDRAALLAHFLALEEDDRRLRFGVAISDDVVREYVARLDFAHDGLFAVQDDRERALAVVHVAFGDDTAELGLSVLPGLRGKGIGSALFARAAAHLRNRGISQVFVHCLTENGAMMRLARKHAMAVTRDGGESRAFLELAPLDTGTLLHEWLHDQQSIALHGLRRNLQSLQSLWFPRLDAGRAARAALDSADGNAAPRSTPRQGGRHHT